MQGRVMTEPTQHSELLGRLLDSDTLRDWMADQRWYASKSRGLLGVELLDVAALGEQLYLALVQTRLATGTHEIYQLLLVTRDSAEDDGLFERAVTTGADVHVYPALQEPRNALVLLRNLLSDSDIVTATGSFSFRHIDGAYNPGDQAVVRAMGAQQSNSSIVIDEHVALKLFRKVESGINPELEMLRFLTSRNFEHIAGLQGWYEYEGSSLASTLGVAQAFVPASRDGWELALDEIIAAPDSFLAHLDGLGRVTAQMHTTLASDANDPAFSPEDPTSESMSLLTASIDEDIERIFMRLPDDDSVAAIRGRGEDVRAKLANRSRISSGGKQIRIHGDYHLGQTLETPRGWVILDFEGEPGRSLPERRQKRSPLRDVAGMLRSLAYATSAVELQRGGMAPEGLEEQAREVFLSAYLDEVDPALLPAGEAAVHNLLSIFELEKAVYELRYELNNRPDWVEIPVAGIRRLLDDA
jgi:maltokinase